MWQMLALLTLAGAAQPAPLGPHDHLPALRTPSRHPGAYAVTRDDALGTKLLLTTWLEAPVPAGLDRNTVVAHDKIAPMIRDYDLQYVGVRYRREPGPDGTWTYAYRSEGSRAVLVHGIHSATARDMKINLDTDEAVVFDGGANFFDALIDLDHHKVVWFAVHGYA